MKSDENTFLAVENLGLISAGFLDEFISVNTCINLKQMLHSNLTCLITQATSKSAVSKERLFS